MYRGRKNDAQGNLFANVYSDLWYPKPEFISKLGRFNKIGEQIFYCTPNYNATPFECGIKSGDIFTMLECVQEGENEILFPEIFLSNMEVKAGIEFNFTKTKDSEAAILALEQRGLRDIHNKIHEFLREISLRSVSDTDEYKISVAVKEILFEKFPFFSGLAYPSVTTEQNNINLALKPSIVSKCYKPNIVRVMKVHPNPDDQRFFILELINQSISIDINTGDIDYEIKG